MGTGGEAAGREGDHSPPSSAEAKNAWSYTSTPQHVFMSLCLVKHTVNFAWQLPAPAVPGQVFLPREPIYRMQCDMTSLQQTYV